MSDIDYYPAGAYYDPNAPYNQSEPDPVRLKANVWESMVKTATIETTSAYECSERVEEGYIDHWYETDDVNWRDDYRDSCPSLEELLKDVVKLTDCILHGDNIDLALVKKLNEHCQGWECEEFDAEKAD